VIQAIILKRLAALAITFAATSAVPYILMDRPVLSAAWGRFGPVIVDRAQDRVDDLIDSR